MLKEWIRKVAIKRIKKAPANRLNVCVVSMMRCGVSAVGVVLSDIHEGIYGIPINWHYVEDHIRLFAENPLGWHSVYNVNPYVVDEIYDKVLIIQRDIEPLREAQRVYNQARAIFYGWTVHPSEIERMDKTFDFLYPQIYDHAFEEDRYFLLKMDAFNAYTEKSIEALCEWLGFDMHTYKKHVVIIPVKPERDWDVNSCKISSDTEIYGALKIIGEIHAIQKRGR
ncbi:unnamed protein product [marine sediment metagenome]|uniref:Sulfotransferase domain-containing protein n=1 Tax=marine sediment metagenome TaxID=412755 RepID=X0T6H9_9ZZZZ